MKTLLQQCTAFQDLPEQLDDTLDKTTPGWIGIPVMLRRIWQKGRARSNGGWKASVNLIKIFCSAGDALLSNTDPLVWWHMLIKSSAGHPLHPNLLVSKPICVCACVCVKDFTSLSCSILTIASVLNCMCVCVCVFCAQTCKWPFLFMHVPNVCMHGDRHST